VKVGGGEDSVSASNESLAGASRDNNVISRQAAITLSHAPHTAALFQPQSPDGSSSYFGGCSQNGESPRQSRVLTRSGRGFAASRGTTSRYLDDDDDDTDQSEFYGVQLHPARQRHLFGGRSSAGARRRRPQPTASPGRLEPSEWRRRPGGFVSQRRRAKPRTKTRSRVLTQNVEGYASDTPAASLTAGGDVNIRCSGYSSDSVDPTAVSLNQRRRDVVSTAAQTTQYDVIEEHGGTGSGNRRLMSDDVLRYLESAATWDERHGCSTCSSSSSDSSSEFDYYLDRPLSTSGLGWSSSATASPLHTRKCSSVVKQCIVS